MNRNRLTGKNKDRKTKKKHEIYPQRWGWKAEDYKQNPEANYPD